MSTSHPIPSAQLLNQLNWRYATKKFDSARKISAEDWATLEEALVLSASSGGLQPWTFLVVTDPEVRAKLSPAAFGQSQGTEASPLVVFTSLRDVNEAYVDSFLDHVSKVRNIPLDALAAYRGMLVGGIVNAKDADGRRAWAARQVYIALGTLLTSAALLGIDACPMEGFAPAQFDEILGLEEKGLAAAVICTLGYRSAEDGYAALPKVRFPKEKVIQHVG